MLCKICLSLFWEATSGLQVNTLLNHADSPVAPCRPLLVS